MCWWLSWSKTYWSDWHSVISRWACLEQEVEQKILKENPSPSSTYHIFIRRHVFLASLTDLARFFGSLGSFKSRIGEIGFRNGLNSDSLRAILVYSFGFHASGNLDFMSAKKFEISAIFKPDLGHWCQWLIGSWNLTSARRTHRSRRPFFPSKL